MNKMTNSKSGFQCLQYLRSLIISQATLNKYLSYYKLDQYARTKDVKKFALSCLIILITKYLKLFYVCFACM